MTSSEYRCAPWTRSAQVDPIGSAMVDDTFVLVEVPGPWPGDIAELPAVSEAVAASDGRVRVLAVAPPAEEPLGVRRVTMWRRTGAHCATGLDHLVEATVLTEVLAELIADPGGSPGTLVGEAPREVVVCTHGRRDACCGNLGTRLHAEVHDRWADVRVRRCSHLGGHRFAPTAITFPDTRMWAHLDADVLARIVDRTGAVGALHRHQRGTTALGPHLQVLERAVFEHVGWRWLEAEMVETDLRRDPDGGAHVELRWCAPVGSTLPPGHALGHVAARRRVPVLACGQPPERAAKTSTEFELQSFGVEVVSVGWGQRAT